jgi:hypothetical protein
MHNSKTFELHSITLLYLFSCFVSSVFHYHYHSNNNHHGIIVITKLRRHVFRLNDEFSRLCNNWRT